MSLKRGVGGGGGETDRQTDRDRTLNFITQGLRFEREADRQTDRQTDRQIDRQRQTETETDAEKEKTKDKLYIFLCNFE